MRVALLVLALLVLPAAAQAKATLGLAHAPWSLPVTWCGEPASADRPSDTQPRVKFIYAWPTDRAPRFKQVADGLQASASALGIYIAKRTGGRKTLRFDTGTSCGASYLDLQTVALPHASADYMTNGHGDLEKLGADLPLDFDPPSPVIYVLVVEGLQGTLNGEAWRGMGRDYRFGLVSIYPRDQLGLGRGQRRALMPRTILHELSHSLGAVAHDAPNSDKSGHCLQGAEVMCQGYLEVGRLECPAGPDNGPVRLAYDCGGDDYFNPAPPAGSWLAEHPAENLYLSPHFAPCAELPAQCRARPDEDRPRRRRHELLPIRPIWPPRVIFARPERPPTP